jgi:hypothetical protein
MPFAGRHAGAVAQQGGDEGRPAGRARRQRPRGQRPRRPARGRGARRRGGAGARHDDADPRGRGRQRQPARGGEVEPRRLAPDRHQHGAEAPAARGVVRGLQRLGHAAGADENHPAGIEAELDQARRMQPPGLDAVPVLGDPHDRPPRGPGDGEAGGETRGGRRVGGGGGEDFMQRAVADEGADGIARGDRRRPQRRPQQRPGRRADLLKQTSNSVPVGHGEPLCSLFIPYRFRRALPASRGPGTAAERARPAPGRVPRAAA